MRSLIRKHFGKQKKEVVHKIMTHTMRYMFRLVSAHEMTRAIRVDLEDPSVRIIDYRKEIQEGYIIKNIKFWVWYIIANRLSKKKSMKIMSEFGIRDDDRCLAFVAKKYLDRDLVKLAKKYDAHSLHEFKSITEKCLKETESYTKKFAYRKLRFLIADGTTMDDIHMELNYWGLYTIILQYPQIDDMKHCLNLYRRGVHNHGINMIKKATTAKNNVLVQNGDGTFENLKASAEVVDVKNMSEFSVSHEEERDNKLFVSKMLKENNGKKNKFLKLMTGTYSEKFSDFLSRDGYIENNDDLFDRLLSNDNIDLYMSLCAKFLRITPYQAKQFVNHLRSKYREEMND